MPLAPIGDAASGSAKERGGLGRGADPLSCPVPGSVEPNLPHGHAGAAHHHGEKAVVGEGGVCVNVRLEQDVTQDPLTSPGPWHGLAAVFFPAWNSSSQGWHHSSESILVPGLEGGGGTAHCACAVAEGEKDSTETRASMNRNGLGKGAAAWQQLCSAHTAWCAHGLRAGGPEEGHGTIPMRPSGPQPLGTASTGTGRRDQGRLDQVSV